MPILFLYLLPACYRYHAQLLVVCLVARPDEEHLRQSQLVAKFRMANSVKKSAVFAFLDEDEKVSFKELIWDKSA